MNQNSKGINMKQNLIVKGKQDSELGKSIGSAYSISSEFVITKGARTTEVNKNNLLLIDPASLDESKIFNEPDVLTALEHGIPVVIIEPTATLLTGLTGFGIEGTDAAIIVKGKGPYYYSTTYMKAGNDSTEVKTLFAECTNPGEEELAPEPEIHSNLVAFEKIDLPKKLLEQLNNLDEVELILNDLAQSAWQQDDIPANRRWSHYWSMEDWKSIVLSDPSGEQTKTQTARFRFTTVFSLLAANTPVQKKIVNISVGGTGFEPFGSGQSLIRDNTKHRGWAQSMTFTEFVPQGNEFGNIEAYQPNNTADAVTITTGYSWDIGFTGGAGPEGPSGSVSFSYSQNASSSIATKDFETKAETLGNAGMRFYHNCHVVGGDTIIDATQLFANSWNSTMGKMFYYHFPQGDRVRSWPGLARTLLMPGSECVWYAKPDENGIGTMSFGGNQGLNYCYSKKGINHCASIENRFLGNKISINMGKVNYNDPKSA
jgi:hypothetical protein